MNAMRTRMVVASRTLLKGILEPQRAANHAWVSLKSALLWEHRYGRLRDPKKRGALQLADRDYALIRSALQDRGYSLRPFALDLAEVARFASAARYERFPFYYAGGVGRGFHEKVLEHYLAARLLGLTSDDVYIDVASQTSPAPVIYREMYGCRTYRQDLRYPPGIHGDEIGGNASSMSVKDGFATSIALHNAFEHFEGDSDTGFIREASRVLASRGRLCIVPLFLAPEYAIQTDPSALRLWERYSFDSDATLYAARGWRDRHGRFYDVRHLTSRITDHLGDLRLTIFEVTNAASYSEDCYLRFAALMEKP